MAREVILYDLPSKGRNACWSLNPWKTRLVLNYKNIPYKTEWLEYPDVAPKLKSLGLPPNESGMAYTIPSITLPDGRHLTDSAKIAPELEKLYPSPPLHVSDATTQRAQDGVNQCMSGLGPIALPRVPVNILSEASVGYFESTRKERFGMTLAELGESEKAKEGWTVARPGLEALRDFLKEDVSGPFVKGQEPRYADFIILGWMQFLKRCGEDMFQRVVEFDVAFQTLYAAGGKWLERDDH